MTIRFSNLPAMFVWIVFCVVTSALLPDTTSAEEPIEEPIEEPKGHLVIVGGGGTPDAVMQETIRLAGGNDAKIVLIATASTRKQAGQELKTFFKSFGATNTTVLDVDHEDNAIKQLENAALVWMGGGSQSRLVNSLKPKLKTKIVEMHRDGCIVGGTSAGAAAMSSRMITGQADLRSIRAQSTELATGLGLTEIIVDQHFNQRQRFNRLLAAVLDHPNSLGIGIDEKTAIIIHRSKIRVLGQSNILILDARKSATQKTESGQHHTATDVTLHLVAAGQEFDLANSKLARIVKD